MDTVGVRQLRQEASALLRRVARGETLGVTDRGRLVALLAPPSSATGTGALQAAGRVRDAVRSPSSIPEPAAAARPTGDVLAEVRSDR